MPKTTKFLFCVALVFLRVSGSLADQLAQSTASNINVTQSATDTNRFPKSLTLDFSLVGISYFSSSEADSNFQQRAQLDLQFGKDFGNLGFNGSALAGSFNLPRSSYFAIPELNASVTAQLEKNILSAGRKIQTLSFIDQNLNLGEYNSYFSNDLLTYRTLGLTGLHAQMQSSIFGFIGSYCPLYFPNQGPQVYEDNGALRTANRWAQKPPTEFQFGSQNREIVYAIRDYDIKEIVNNPGYAVSTYVGLSEDRPWVQASYSRKPVNELPLSRDTFGTAANFTGQVKLSPTVLYTQIQSVDINADFSTIKMTFSYLEDHPENKIAAENETMQFLEPLKVYGIWLSTDLENFLSRRLTTEISYAEIQEGGIKDLMSDGRPSLFTFSSRRTLFKKPFSVKVQSDLALIRNKPLVTSLKWTYDTFFKGSLLMTRLQYEAFAKLNLNMGFDILGVENNKTMGENFLQSNQANDRIYAGLDYVF